MDIAETCNIISFKGVMAGTLSISVKPTLANSEQLVGEKPPLGHLGKKVEFNNDYASHEAASEIVRVGGVRTAFFYRQDGLSTPWVSHG